MSVRTVHTSTHSDLPSYAIQNRPTLGSRVASVARRGWQTYWQRRARRATLLLLASLDDRTLHDIGLSASEIPSVVYGAADRTRSYRDGWPAPDWRSRHPQSEATQPVAGAASRHGS